MMGDIGDCWDCTARKTGPAAFLASMASFCDVTWPPYMLPTDQQERENKVTNADDKDPATAREQLNALYEQLPPENARSLHRTMKAVVNAVKATLFGD